MFITIETLQFNSVADILSLGVFNSKKYVTGFSYEDEFSKSKEGKVYLPYNFPVTMVTASQSIFP